MDPEFRFLLQGLSWSTAYALACGCAYRESPDWAVRFAAGLLVGALFGRLTSLALVGRVLDPVLWTPWGGGTLLAVPAGLLLSAFIDGSRNPVGYFDFALRHACIALAIARLGCFAAGCCSNADFAGLQLAEAAAFFAASRSRVGAIGLVVGGGFRIFAFPWKNELHPEFAWCASLLWCWIGFIMLSPRLLPHLLPPKGLADVHS